VRVVAVGARLVEIGQVASATIALSAATVRSRFLVILGYANFHAPHDARAAAYRWLAEQARDGELAVVVEQVALRDIEHAWERQRSAVDRKLVVTF
jgi:hypothetical protein